MPSTQPRVVPWTPEEDERLSSAVASCGSKICWKKVAASMPSRNNKSCRKRWLHSLDPKLRKGRWTSDEDAALLESVAKYGTRWYEVARALPGRTDDQCAKRYKEAVDPSIRRDPWKEIEDEQLWNAFKKHGNKWHTISSALQGRPAIHCRNRLQSLQRARAAVEDSTSPSASEPSSGSGNLSSPSFSSPPTPSPPSPSGPLTPLPLLLKQRTPAGGPSQGNSSAATMIPVYDGEPDRQFDLGTSMESPQNGSYHIPPQMFQDGFAITPSTPTNPSSSCWQEPILPNEHWKDFPEGSSMTGGIVQSYQPPQILTIHVDFTSPLSDPSQSCIPFIMTCPVPHCCYQCQSVVEIWRHITWTHIRPRPEDGIEGIVEKVVLGNV